MRSSYKFSEEGIELYFMTFTIVEWVPIFIRNNYCAIIIDNFDFYRREQDLRIHYYVIMPDHIHFIASSTNNISNIIRNLKSYSAREIIDNLIHDKRKWILNLLKYYKKKSKLQSEFQLWQEGSHPEMIIDEKMLKQKVNYIHFNPVKAGFIKEPEYWIYSSAAFYAGLDSVMECDEIE